MTTSYDHIAGQNAERLAALSDGVFAIAMTLLVLDLRAPGSQLIHTEHDLGHALLVLSPRLLMYMLSFMTLGIFWVGQQTQLNHLERSSRNLTWIHLAFLFLVTVVPFSTALLSEHISYRLALVVYWVNILLLGATLYWSWVCALGSGLVKSDIPTNVSKAIKLRIVIAQSLYAVGMLLCVISNYLSIAFIVAVQLNYVVSVRRGVQE
jgi:TMEM175 potassium channel family protein